MVDAIRQAFASGQSAAGENLLADALEAGLAWDVATRAVAEGVAHHYDPALRPNAAGPPLTV